MYISPFETPATSSETPADVAGLSGDSLVPAALTAREQTRVWSGSVPTPGLWHFVGEIRSRDTTQVVKLTLGHI